MLWKSLHGKRLNSGGVAKRLLFESKKIGSASSGKSSYRRLLVVRQLPSKAYLCMGITWDCWSIYPPFYSPWDISKTTSQDRKSTRLNSSHRCISYAVFCLKKKKK